MPGHKSDYLEFGIKVGLDSKEAQKELQELQKQLNSLGTLSNPGVGDKLSADMQKASQAAAQLKIALDSAIDVDTGKLDLSKFSRSLKDSGMKLKDYRDQLMSMGPEGEKAFTQVANSILKAEAPLRRTSKLIDTMWTTLKNTARWELSSSILHGLESSLQKAVTYAQDLNKSLTDIRIVTGYSTDHMAEFAIEANKAAKALSATTTEYTNASLIYFQQGLSDQQVKERTEVTVKMANVTRDSAQTVSDQMTAVWNNFADGSHTLEYYADVMTALGAATASSTKEISDGLEKFAAVAETVGLSYEYAASALATITSNTRQSADVVGTALKTLFARIQGLSLGETLEDGTDLNKYSEALAKVGIQVKEQNGELKAMDDILNEMASVWDKLNNDQQVALAQTVAGVRQYTQLVALMENWDNGDEDSMMANLRTSANATGALQEQADIYAESWEAARDRVTAALESIFNKLLKDEFFIDTLNSIEKIITGIDKFIDSIGGLQGVLTGLGAVATKVFAGQMSSGLQNLAYNLNFGAVKERDKQMRIDAANAESEMLVDTHPGQSDAYKKIGKLQVKMIEHSDQMSDVEKELVNHAIERYKNLAKQTEEMEQQAQIAERIAKQTEAETTDIKENYHEGEKAIHDEYDGRIAELDKEIENSKKKKNKGAKKSLINERSQLIAERDSELIRAKQEDNEANRVNFIDTREKLKNSIGKKNAFEIDNKLVLEKAKEQVKILEKQKTYLEKGTEEYDKITKELKKAKTQVTKLENKQKALNQEVDNAKKEYADYVGEEKANLDTDIFNDADIKKKKAAEAPDQLKQSGEDIDTLIDNSTGKISSWSDILVEASNSVMSLSFGITTLSSIWTTLEDPDLSSWEKISSVFSSLAMGLPMVISGIKGLNTSVLSYIPTSKTLTTLTNAENMAIVKSILSKNGATLAEKAKQIAEKIGIPLKHAQTIATMGQTGATIAETAAAWGLNTALSPLLIIILALTASIITLVAVGYGLVKLFQLIIENTPEGKLKKLTEEAEAAAEAADKTEEAYNNLKTTIESYDTAINKIAGLTKGTEEFQQAIEEANEKARELIDTYGITKGVTLDKNGVLQIDPEELENKQQAAKRSTDALRFKSFTDNIEKETQQLFNDTGKTVDNLFKNIGEKFFDSEVKEAFITNFEEILAESIDGEITGETLAEILNVKEYEGNFAEWADRLANSLSTNDAAVKSAQTVIAENTGALKDNTAALLMGSGIFEGQEWYEESEHKATLAKMGGEKVSELFDSYLKGTEDGEVEIVDENGETVTISIDEYLNDMGYRFSWNESEGKNQWYDSNSQQWIDLDETAKREIVASDQALNETRIWGEEQSQKLNNDFDQTIADSFDAFNNNRDASQLDNAAIKELQSMSDNDKQSIEAFLGDEADGYFEWINSLVENEREVFERLQAQREQYQAEAEQAGSIYDILFSEGEEGLSEEQLAYLDQLEQKYGALAEIRDRSSKEYAEALRIIQEANESMAIGAMLGQEQELWDQYNQKVDEGKENTEEAKALLDEICALDYEIQLSINEDIESDLDNIYNKIDKVTSAAEKIGEGFKVSADDIREVAEAFPGILEGYKVLANGQIQLNEKVAKAAIDAAHTEIKADKKTALEKIKTQKKEVQTRLTVLKTMLQIAQKRLKGELSASEAESQMKEAVTEYNGILKDQELKKQAEVLTQEEKNLDEFDTQSKESAEYSYNAFIQGPEKGLEAEKSFIEQAIGYMNEFVRAGQAAAALQVYNNSLPEIARSAFEPWTYDGEKGSSGDYSDASDSGGGEGSPSFSDFLSENGYEISEESIAALEGEISSWENLLNELDIQEAELMGQMGELGNDLNNVGQGDGSGGSGKEEELKDPKNYEDEIERYHENTRALERLERALNRVTTAKDRAFGKERLRLIEEEIAATEKLANQQKDYLTEIAGYLAIDRSRVKKYGFTFDENGEITNYNEVYRQQVDKFNASRTEAAEKAYEKFVEDVEKYEETLALLDEEQIKYQEYLNSLVDLKLEKITTEVEVKIRVNDIELTKLEYMLKKLQREGAAAADEIKNIADQINETMEKAGPIQEAIDKIYEQARAEGRGLTAEETAEMQSFYADGVIDAQEQERVNAIYAKANAENRVLTQAEEDQIQEYKEQLLQLNEEVWELADTIEGKLIEELDELSAEFDENLNRLTSYTQMYENLQNVLELTGKAKTAEGLNALNQLSASTLKNSTNALKANKANYDTFVELAAEANRHLQEAIEVGDKHMIDYWTEQVEDVTIRMEEAHTAMIESFNNALEAAGNLFDTKVQNMITKLKKDLGDLDTMVDLYKRASDLEKLYLSSNQSIYELSKLSRDIGKSIEDTSNLIAKNKLGDLMKEINRLRAEGVQLSKYDLEYWKAKYELELAEIALQEAQEAKSQVKLTRNSEGGWGYVYTADSDKIAEAEQNFEDKLYNMQKINEDYIGKYSEDLLKNRQEMLNALAKIDKTREDYDAEVLRVKEEYMAKEEFYVSELTKAYERQGIAYGDTILGMISNDESLLKSHENFKDRTLELINEELIPAHEEWLVNVQDVCDEAGYSYDELTNGVLENMDSVDKASTELTEKTLKEQEDMRESMKETMQEIKNWQLQYLETIDAMVAANEAYYDKTIADYSNAMQQVCAIATQSLDLIVNAARAACAAIAAAAQQAAREAAKDVLDDKGDGDEGYHQKPVTSGANGLTPWDPMGEHRNNPGRYGSTEEERGNISAPPAGYSSWTAYNNAKNYERNGWDAPDLDKQPFPLYDTGGYTGSWGNGWKLAGLHEKELVLNKHDTKNMLDMVNTLRDIDWRAKLNELWTNIEDQFINPVFGGTEELLQQVHIEANFPDLKDHFEIEEAFRNLINTASQYANRK